MAGETIKTAAGPTTLYRLDQLEKKQEEKLGCIQEKLDELVSMTTDLRTDLRVSNVTTDLAQKAMNERLGKLEERLDTLQTQLADQIVKSTGELATLKTDVGAVQKYGPGVVSGAATSTVIVGLVELLMKVMGGA